MLTSHAKSVVNLKNIDSLSFIFDSIFSDEAKFEDETFEKTILEKIKAF